MSNKHKLYGAILGDLVGKPYEMKPIKSKQFDWYNPENHYTDDTIMTLATANKLMNDSNYELEYKWWGSQYYGDYYGKGFKEWIKSPFGTINDSYGNGAAMRVSPIGYMIKETNDVTKEAALSIKMSHSHMHSMRGAAFMAKAVNLLHYKLTSESITELAALAGKFYGKEVHEPLKQFEKFKVSCNDTVPVAYQVFASTYNKSVEECIRTAVWLGGDCDTIGSMAAEMWVAYNGGLENKYVKQVESALDTFQLATLHKFNSICTS